MKININGDTAYVYTPYNPDFVKRIKSIGGARWDGAKKAWTVRANAVADVRTIMMEVYGETDDRTQTAEKVDVRLTFVKSVYGDRAPVSMLGKTIASAFGRDSGARVGDGVSFVSGSPESGGSAKNWTTYIPEGCVCILHNVPKSIVTDENISEGVEYVIEGRKEEDARAALIAERERLLARIAEIDALLEDK